MQILLGYMCGNPTSGEYRDLLCFSCVQVNEAARKRVADLHGKIAFVTGKHTHTYIY